MKLFHLPFGIRKSNYTYSAYITQDEYRNLMDYAREHHVKLENFKKFSGDINLIKELIDDIAIVAEDFPKILTVRKSVVIRLDEHSPLEDFATTDYHLISINSKLFNDRLYLEEEYELLSRIGKFVKNTNYRSIIRHELGHVVANIYRLNPLKIARSIFPDKTNEEILQFIKSTLSLYAADYKDGREFISEYFSAYYSQADVPYATKYIDRCKELAKEDSEL